MALVESSGEFEFGDEREVELKGLTGTHQVFESTCLELARTWSWLIADGTI